MPSARTLEAGNAVIKLSMQDNVSQGLSKIQGKLRGFGDSLKTIGATGLAAATAVGAPFLAAIKLASDAQETLSKFQVVFGAQTKAMRAFGDELAKTVGRSKYEVAGTLASFQDLLVPMGMAADSAAVMGKTLTKLSIDLGSFNNMADADVVRDLQAALTGSGEVMKKYGVIVSEAAVKQELLNMGLDPKKVSEAEKAQARLNIIMRGTTAAQGDAIRTADGFANQLKKLKSQIVDAATEIGMTLLPEAQKLAAAAIDVTRRLADWGKANADTIADVGKLTAKVALLSTGIWAIGTALRFASSGVGLLKKAIVLAVANPVVAGVLALLTAITAMADQLRRAKNEGQQFNREMKKLRAPATTGPRTGTLAAADANATSTRDWQKGRGVAPAPVKTVGQMERERLAADPFADTPTPNKEPRGIGVSGSAIFDKLREVADALEVEIKAKLLRAQFELQGPMARGRNFLKQFTEKRANESKSVATLDARLASQQFGRGRNRSEELLAKIEGHTKRVADKEAGQGIGV